MKFELKAPYSPAGDQPKAIQKLIEGINNNVKEQVLLGATGTGKTYTISNVIASVNKPTLVLVHNKTLAAQLYMELKTFFPNNAVEYFISNFDYYQPEAYVPGSDTYIAKDTKMNLDIDRLRNSATASLFEREDVIIVSSVAAIYGLGSPSEYKKMSLSLRKNMKIDRDGLLLRFVEIMYERNDIDFSPGKFRARGDIIEIYPVYGRNKYYRIEMFGDEIEVIYECDYITGNRISEFDHILLFPASHYISEESNRFLAIERIRAEMKNRVEYFEENNMLVEAQRLRQRTDYDMEMLMEVGFCSGIENYSMHIGLRDSGETPYTLFDYFPDDYLVVVDESHVTLPQIRGMFNGDRARKLTLVNYGFRLPSALDNRPLFFEEFESKINQAIYVSATPGDYELAKVDNVIVEQIIRPTGLIDPTISIHGSDGQIDHLFAEITKNIANGERTLITTLTIKMSEELTDYLKKIDIKVAYLHSEIKTLERSEIINSLRIGTYDVLIGINLLREGLDIPEVSLICILDADKEGFLRSKRSLIQIIGRAARNSNGRVIMYADRITDSMQYAIDETNRRREIQMNYNLEHNIIATTIKKSINDVNTMSRNLEVKEKSYSKVDREKMKLKLEKQMQQAAKDLDFELAIQLRDQILKLEN